MTKNVTIGCRDNRARKGPPGCPGGLVVIGYDSAGGVRCDERFGVAALLLAMYVGSYFALVKAEYGWHGFTTGFGPYKAHPVYRIGGESRTAVAIYWPIQKLDERMRPKFWADRP